MRLYGIDPELIEIYNIRNIESIKVWDLVLGSNSKELIIPAILVVYDGGKNLNLSAKDKFFDVFVKKVLEVYRDEKENILEDSLTDPFRLHSNIDCDKRSAAILDKGSISELEEIYKFYRNKDAYRESLLFQYNEVKRFLPMIKYHLEQLFSMSDRSVSIGDQLTGYRDRYLLEGSVNGVETVFPLTFERINSNEYIFKVGGAYKPAVSSDISIKFLRDSVLVMISIGEDVISETAYKIVNGTIKMINRITNGERVINYCNVDLQLSEKSELDNLKSLDKSDNLEWYRLPWGALYGVRVNVDDLSKSEKIIEIHSNFVDSDGDGFISREYHSTNYKRMKTALVEAEDLVLDEFGKRMIGVAVNNDNTLFVIETSFDESTKDYYTNSKSFYHVTFSRDGIKGIEGKNFVSLGRNKKIVNSSDLVNKQKLMVLVKGE